MDWRRIISNFNTKFIRRFYRTSIPYNRTQSMQLHVFRRYRFYHLFPSTSAFKTTTATGLILLLRFAVLQSKETNEDEAAEENMKLPKRLKRFRKFASIEYDGEIFLTPQDFLDSLTLDQPRERIFRTVINEMQLKRMLKNTPPLRKGSHHMFRDLGENGIISYAEYLFMITLLTKSHYSFNVAFIMFDEDDNMQIDKEEFLKIQYLIASGTRQPRPNEDEEDNKYNQDTDQCRLDVDLNGDFLTSFVTIPTKDEEFEHLINTNVLFGSKTREWLRRERKRAKSAISTTANMENVVNEMKQHDTTLTVHLFGRSGRDSLSFDQFQTFYEFLQKELIEIGKDRISSVDFARLVLRYSILHRDEQSPYIRRVYERSEYDDEGITLQQFETFSMFLNNLEDFSKAVRLYTVADIPVSQSEFIRAVRCSTGFNLHPGLVKVLFKIFDTNDDDQLSYSEFIAVMSDRLSRGFKRKQQESLGWQQFRHCVKNELSGLS